MSGKRRAATEPDVEPIAEQAPAEPAAMAIPPTLGPGDDDGKDRGAAAPAVKPLGPGDDDPASPDRGVAGEIRGPLAPGEADPNDKVNRNVRMLAQPAPGPGDTFAPRRITVFENKE